MSAQQPAAQPHCGELPAGLSFRALHWRDIPHLVAAERELFPDDAWPEITWWRELAGRPRREYLVVVDQSDAVVGYGGLDHAGTVSDVMTVGVLPAAQGQGVGRALVAQFLARARARGAEALMLEVRADNAAARALYSRMGFEHISIRRRYYQPGGVDAIVMRALLPTESRPWNESVDPHD